MSAVPPRRKKSYTPYYECYRLSKYKGFPCDVRRINAEMLEKLFLQTLGKLSWDENLVVQTAAEQTVSLPNDTELRQKETALGERLQEIERKIANILVAV